MLNSKTAQDKAAEKEFFKRFEDSGYEAFTGAGYKRLIDEFERLHGPILGKHVVDFGCGTGAFTTRIGQHGVRVTGVDITLECVASAQMEQPSIEWVVSDIEKTGLQDSCADIVTLSGVMHHFPSLRRVLRESYRILKKRGRLFAYDPNMRNPVMWLLRDEKSPIRSIRGITRNERLLASEEVGTVLEEEGFRAISVYAMSGIGFKHVAGKLTQLSLPIYNVWDHLFAKTPWSRRFGSFIISSAQK